MLEKLFGTKKSKSERLYRLIQHSGLFDERYYLYHNADVNKAGIDPLKHYLEGGWREGRQPNEFFDTSWYLDQNPDVALSSVHPLLHYLQVGGRIGRDPSPRFSSVKYLEINPDVAATEANPLAHYLLFGRVEGRRFEAADGEIGAEGPLTPYEAWLKVNTLSIRDIAELKERLAERRATLPKISIITPVYDTDRKLLEELVTSVKRQIHGNWELCLVNDASPSAHIVPILERFSRDDPRIVVKHLEENGGISVATNAGVEMATGDIVLFLDHDDLLTPDCVAELAIYYADHADADIVYSDDDKMDLKGRRYAPQFKPDWSPVLLLSWMYISHVFSVRRGLFQKVGGFRKEYDGSQDYDFALRASEVARHVGHIPKILYHWRAVEGSTATGGEAKPDSMKRGLAAVEEALERRRVKAKAVWPDWASEANSTLR